MSLIYPNHRGDLKIMNSEQGIGVIERVIYGIAMVIATKLAAAGYMDGGDATWFAGGAVALIGGTIAWFQSRPSKLATRAASVMPQNTQLIISATPEATHVEKEQVVRIAAAASDKVSSKV